MHRRLLIAVFLGAVAFFTAHLINLMVAHALTKSVGVPKAAVTPETRLKSKVDRMKLAQDIMASGIFAAPKTSAEMMAFGATALASGTGGLAPQGPPIDAAKKVKLIGTVVGDRKLSIAVLEDIGSKRQTLYHIHELIPGVGEVGEIRRDSILIRQGNQQELLELANGLPSTASASQPATATAFGSTGSGLSRMLDRREVAQSMADLPRLLSQARASAFYVNGKQAGWRIDHLAPQSFYEKAGLQSGDVLQRLNGTELRDPSMLLAFFQQVKDEQRVTLDLLRNEQKTTIVYDIR